MREYCRDIGVKESAFYWRPGELGRRGQARKAARSRSGVRSRSKPAGSSARDGGGRPGASKRTRRIRHGKRGAETPAGRRPSGHEASPFVPIHVLAGSVAAGAVGVEIHLGDGCLIRVPPGFDRQTLLNVLAVLEGRAC